MGQDATAKRCYGVDRKIKDCGWDFLSSLRTLKEPHEPMPRLSELLEWLAEPENHKIWIILDIKVCTDISIHLGILLTLSRSTTRLRSS